MTTRALSSLALRGTGSALSVPAILVTGAALGMPWWLQSQGETLDPNNVANIRSIAAAVVGVFVIAWVYLSCRRVTVFGGEILLSTWFGTRRLAIDDVTDITIADDVMPHADGFTWQTHFVLWNRRGKPLRLNTLFWSRDGLRQLARTLCAQRPGIQVGPRARGFVEG